MLRFPFNRSTMAPLAFSSRYPGVRTGRAKCFPVPPLSSPGPAAPRSFEAGARASYLLRRGERKKDQGGEQEKSGQIGRPAACPLVAHVATPPFPDTGETPVTQKHRKGRGSCLRVDELPRVSPLRGGPRATGSESETSGRPAGRRE